MKTRIASLGALCVAAATVLLSHAAEPPQFNLKLVAEGFVSPTAAVPHGEGELLIADQPGTIHRVGKDGKLAEKLFLDLRPRMAQLNSGFDERGLLGLVLHPKFAENKKFYVMYSAPLRPNAPKGWNHTARLSQFTAGGDGASSDLQSEKVLLEIDEPYFNHNGGAIVFGPDGYLYIASGDGGGGNDVDDANKPLGRPPEGNGQNLDTLLGKILRLDVNSGDPYGVPKDNPLVGKKGRPEIFAYGFRNPWRISFDRGGQRELIAADVGQDRWEEVNVVKKGGNYGWRIREAFACFDPKNPKNPPADCPKTGAQGEPLIDPVLAYKSVRGFPGDPEAKGISITGGYVYRGKAFPQWNGKYIFADWSTHMVVPGGILFAATQEGSQWSFETITPESHKAGLKMFVTAFGEDQDGELFVLTNGSSTLSGKNGKVFKIVPAK